MTRVPRAITLVRDESASVVTIFLSSRENSNILAASPGDSKIRVQEVDTRQDMELYVRHCVSTAVHARNLLNGCVPGGLQQQLVRGNPREYQTDRPYCL